MTHINVVKAALDNADDILKIENACFSTPWSRQSIIESLGNENSHFYIALADGEPAGYAGLQIFSGEGYVTNIATLPEYRRQGVAKALLERVLQNEAEFITLEVRESNTSAIRLYEMFGFETVGKRPKFYREPTEDAVLMTKFFKDSKQ